MQKFPSNENEGGIAYVQGDVAFILFIIVTYVLVLTIQFVHDPSGMKTEETFYVEVSWDGHSPVDIDMWFWCHGPAADQVISYINKKGKHFVLNHDDRGYRGDDYGDENKEILVALSSRLPHARCGLNLHVFGLNGGKAPIEVKATVVINKGRIDQIVLLDNASFIMEKESQEITATAFTVDEKGFFVRDSNKEIEYVPCAMSRTCGLSAANPW